MNLWDILYIVLGYFVGAIPTGIIVSKYFKGPDLQNTGSGNIGATNVTRTMGKKFGAITLFGDAGKAFLVVLFARLFFPNTDYTICLAALACLLGNTYSIFLGFSGGKGVSTTFGIYFALAPLVALVAAIIDAAIVYFAKISAIGSLIGMIVLFVGILFSGLHLIYIVFTLIIVAIVFFRHKNNIQELIKSWKS
ncbi:MAG: acyl-phosphate glycerol 3-phosphate acyltransferase [Deltaproteobacteria bacterium RIFCSPHIGHO2_12_FULL_43_9]|nr:MAG: acyl-phosphate glycerol 3-phosphate acyltransferase [Deltaproteobacteria bacterium RIFCSPHIGHO2_12_FULL_43_9]